MKKILLLSKYGQLGASSRLRSYQYLPYLRNQGWKVDISPLFSDEYLKALYNDDFCLKYVAAGYWKRIKSLTQIKKYDILWIEKELFPFFPSFIERLISAIGISYLVDYDDALFHRYIQHNNWIVRKTLHQKIYNVMKNAELVIAGNKYLAKHAEKSGAKEIIIIPTAVNVEKYSVSKINRTKPVIIGWIGSPSTSHYLLTIENVIRSMSKELDVRFVAIGANKRDFQDLPIEIWKWSEESEIASLRKFDIGIMPLKDDYWERGKCGYKIIQYMACGLPVIASPVGVNLTLVEDGVNGFLASNPIKWENALRTLENDTVIRKRMGTEGRKKVEEWYSLQVQAPRLHDAIQGLIGK